MNLSKKFVLLLTTLVVLVFLTAPFVHAQTVIDPGQPDPNPERTDYQVGVYFQSRGNYERAIAAFSTAIQRQPTLAAAYSARADSYAGLQQYDLAIVDYTQALVLHPQDSLIYVKRAFAFAAQGDLENGQHDFEQVMAINTGS